VTRVEKPKPLMMMVPKLEIPPLGTLPLISVTPAHVVHEMKKGVPTDNTEEEKHVQFVIGKGFPDLVRFQMLILNTSLILA
jgi:hypothetical protein